MDSAVKKNSQIVTRLGRKGLIKDTSVAVVLSNDFWAPFFPPQKLRRKLTGWYRWLSDKVQSPKRKKFLNFLFLSNLASGIDIGWSRMTSLEEKYLSSQSRRREVQSRGFETLPSICSSTMRTRDAAEEFGISDRIFVRSYSETNASALTIITAEISNEIWGCVICQR